MTYWEFTGRELVNCTCEYGCPCQFNALPDKGHCHAVAGIQIDKGHHGDTPLDGLRVGAISNGLAQSMRETAKPWPSSMSGPTKRSGGAAEDHDRPGHGPVRDHVRGLCFNRNQNA